MSYQKSCVALGEGDTCFQYQQAQLLSSRLAWSTLQVSEQRKLQSETLSQKILCPHWQNS